MDFLNNIRWQFDSFEAFVAMGNHGLYVWICYGVALVLLGGNVLLPLIKQKKLMGQLKRRFRSEASAATNSSIPK
ncbi:MAG: heme exporter protein CcmD [Pontibacterium sp.]